MSKQYELIIFTAGTQAYADWALSYLENVNYISHRLYRDHATPQNGYYVKDLSRIGRDLKKTIIVDNISENFQLQKSNGMLIKTWIEDPNDTSLLELAPLLIRISTSDCEDVGDIIQELKDSNDEKLYSIAYGPPTAFKNLKETFLVADEPYGIPND